MKLRAVALLALLVGPFAPASAQQTLDTSPGAGAVRIYDWCLTLETGSVSECSCVAGFYAGATQPDELQLLSSVVRFFDANGEIADPEPMRVALAEMKAALNLTEERYGEILNGFLSFGELGPIADGVCLPLETRVEAAAQQAGDL